MGEAEKDKTANCLCEYENYETNLYNCVTLFY